MYALLTGPMAWLAFGVFFIGVFARIVLYVRGLDWRIDRVTYRRFISHGIKGAVRSVFFWLVPLGTRSWRNNPVFCLAAFGFHVLLLATPVFLAAHQILLAEKWGIRLFSIPEAVADIFTILVVLAGLFLVLRRLGLPEVRIVTSTRDVVLMLLVVMPFITGFLAQHQIGPYRFWLYAHIISGEIMLVAIPFTKLSHFVLFFLSRIQLGMDFGIKRGGMKGRGMAW